MDKVVKQSEIKITIGLNEEKIPVEMKWHADADSQQPTPQDCKAMILALFDKETKDTLRMDLWTKDMQVVEMDRFFFQTLRAMADTYFKATQNNQLAADMQRFVQYFGEQTEIIPKK
ncbi:MAG: gliding motility protein GldC [Saprospiraceae bacterium]